jgi:hypothetical protein
MVAAACLSGGCSGPATRQPVEHLDSRTGVTVATLKRPVEFVEAGALNIGKRTSFAYLGPVEWDRMGEIRYGLWMHVAPGNDRAVVDITSPAAVNLRLDAEVVTLSPLEAPKLGVEPYPAAAPWGQTSYFTLSIELLKRLATADRLRLQVRGVDGQSVEFESVRATRPMLAEFARSRGITVD